MAKKITAILASAALFVALAANAAPDKNKKASAPTCPDCKMVLASKKSAKTPVAVKIGKKTYYCCADCPMGKKKPATTGSKKK
jgi:hypothetical protein